MLMPAASMARLPAFDCALVGCRCACTTTLLLRVRQDCRQARRNQLQLTIVATRMTISLAQTPSALLSSGYGHFVARVSCG